MSFPRYPEYKDSGVEWVGTIPSHWSLPRLRHVSRIRNGSDYKSIQSDNGAYPVIGSGGEFARGTDYLFNGESVLLGRKGTVDKPMYVNGPFWTVDTMFYTEIGASAHARFVYYCACNFPYAQLSTNTALPSMAQEDLANLRLPLPDYQEQSVIASFLDHETARIDALIEDQRRLIDLLKEKRRAVITRAVSKGLDSDAPIKDSGVEWLGEVPAHWSVSALRHFAEIRGGIAIGKRYSPTEQLVEAAYLRVANVQDGYVDLTELKRVQVSKAEVDRYSLREGDVLMNEGGDNDKLGRGTVWDAPIANCLHQNHVFAIRCGKRLIPDWLALFSRSTSARAYFYLYSKQSTNLASISSSNVMSCFVPVPPVSEQRKILGLTSKTLQGIQELIEEANEAIALLNERRTVLISAAVTGKIDVRNCQSGTDAAEPLPMAAEAPATYEARKQ